MRKYKFAILGAGSIAEKMAETVIHMPQIIPYAVGSEFRPCKILLGKIWFSEVLRIIWGNGPGFRNRSDLCGYSSFSSL